MTRVIQAAMILSWGYYLLLLLVLWGGQAVGLHNDIWEMFDLPPTDIRPSIWLILLGLVNGVLMLASLGASYLAIWRILGDGAGQDFLVLGRRIRILAYGLIGFWLGWNLLTGVVMALVVAQHPDAANLDFSWDPLDTDIVFPIVGVALIAISRTMERAWAAEDETRHFL